jgi:hypothetical protein
VRRLVQSASYATLLDSAAEFLTSLQDYPEILVLAQSRGAADDFARSACRGGLLGVYRMTLTALAVDLAEGPLARAGLAPVGGLGAEAMVAHVIHKLKAESIPYFQPVAETPGLARAVARTIAELRLENVRPELVAETGLPGRDLARMAALFEEELAGRSAADFALLLRYAIAAAREGKHRLLGLPVVLLDVDPESSLRRELAEAVLARAPEVFEAGLVGQTAATGRRGRRPRSGGTAPPAPWTAFANPSFSRKRFRPPESRTPPWTTSPPRASRSSVSKSPAASAKRRRTAGPSTRWPSCCGRRNDINRWWKKPCGGPPSRRISAGA